MNTASHNRRTIYRTRPSVYALALLALAGASFAAVLVDGWRPHENNDAAMRAQVSAWGLTDLVLFTEARYTRHPSQADRFAPFQDHPGALEHFPSGALIRPPEHWRSAGTE